MLDNQGYTLSARNAEAVSIFNQAVSELLDYRLSAMPTLKNAIKKEPEFYMAHVLRGYMLMMLQSSKTEGPAQKEHDRARELSVGVTQREQMHLGALQHYITGDWLQATALWSNILVAYPLDIIALRLHHFISFWMGRSQQLMALPSAVLPAWKDDIPNCGNVYGMMCFGLEEMGQYSKAEGYGRKAVELNPNDLWSIHSVAHVLEMQHRYEEGLAWLDYPPDHWDDRNPFRGHLWWHKGLYLLESGRLDEALALYDSAIREGDSTFYLDLQNAAAFLIRLEFLDKDVGDRWDALIEPSLGSKGDHQLAFTDLHNVIALARAGRFDLAREHISSMQDWAESHQNWSSEVHIRVGIPMAKTLLAFEEGDYDRAVVQINLYKPILIDIGASHAQRDVISLIEIQAAKRGGKAETLKHLLKQREFITQLAALDAV